MALTKKLWLVLLVGICVSIVTELLQGLTRLGWADIDDLFNNTVGLLVGVLLFQFIRFVISMIRIKNGELC